MGEYGVVKLIAYGMGLLIILLWILFGIFSYSTSMLLTSIVLVACMLIEAKEAKEMHRVVSYRIRMWCALLLCIGIVLLFVLGL